MSRVVVAVLAAPLALVLLVVIVLDDSDSSAASARTAGPCTVSPGAPAASGGASSGSGAEPAPAGGSPVTLDAGQQKIAATIVGVVKGRKLPYRAALIALTTAYTESTFHNVLVAVDHDSLGVFQQRPASYPGVDSTDPAAATAAFLARMVTVPDWTTRDVGVVAQTVQISAVPEAYDRKGLPVATPLARQLWGPTAPVDPAGGGVVACAAGQTVDTSAVPANASAKGKVALARAHSMLGKPYCYDAGNATGPTMGTDCQPGRPGFDCSGLTLFAWAPYVALPHFSGAQAQRGTRVPITKVRPGDLVFLANATEGNHHVAMIWSVDPHSATGSGQIIEAQDYGVPVHIRDWAGSAEPEVVPYAVDLG